MRHLTPTLLCLALSPTLAPGAAAPPVEQWVVVVAPDFEKAVAPLVAHRRAGGLRVVIVRVRDVLTFKDLAAGNAAPLRDHVRTLCRRHPGRSFVLLVGAATGVGAGVVPALAGTAGRMRGQPSDAGYGCLDGTRLPRVAVGRFPARHAADVTAMVDKTIALESDRTPGAWRRRFTVLAGIPAYNPVVDRLVERIAFARFDRMHPAWVGQAIYTAEGSRFSLPGAQLRGRSREILRQGQAFILYLGHSSAAGLYAGPSASFLDRDDWAELRIDRGCNILFTFGCNGCQLAGRDGEGYGLAAVRNPRGPVAVLGSLGVCYASMVQLACDGLFRRAFMRRLPDRLGDCWLAALDGIATGPIDFLSYRLLDAVDGDPGTLQAAQRQEHLEMFTLLGDPALRLPRLADDVTLDPLPAVAPGRALVVRGGLPRRLRGATVRVALVRSPASMPAHLEPVPARPGVERDRAMLANHRQANRFEMARANGVAKGEAFEVRLAVPATLPAGRLSLRVLASTAEDEALCVQSLEVVRPPE